MTEEIPAWYRKQLVEEMGEDWVCRMGEASVRHYEMGPASGPTGECPHCHGAIMYYHDHDVHYCAMCDIKYSTGGLAPEEIR